ncbi:MAG: excisionase family DNA-binding protein [Lapillicoccus sp.]
MNPIDIFPNAAQLEADQRSTSPTVSVLPLVLTVEAAADRLGVGRTLMYALVKSGAVESVTIGRLRRIPADALDKFVASLRRTDD